MNAINSSTKEKRKREGGNEDDFEWEKLRRVLFLTWLYSHSLCIAFYVAYNLYREWESVHRMTQ